jgi:hypothetical protein
MSYEQEAYSTKMTKLQAQQPKNLPKRSPNTRTCQFSDVISDIILENERGGLWVSFLINALLV